MLEEHKIYNSKKYNNHNNNSKNNINNSSSSTTTMNNNNNKTFDISRHIILHTYFIFKIIYLIKLITTTLKCITEIKMNIETVILKQVYIRSTVRITP